MKYFVCVAFCLTVVRVGHAEGESKVPKVVGERAVVAGQLLRLAELDCRIGIYYIAPQNWRNDIKPGVIYLQTPQPGKSVHPNSIVAAWTFARATVDATTVEVPDLRGENLEKAIKTTEELGLKLLDETIPAGGGERRVVDQYPEAGRQVYRGTSILLTSAPVSGKRPETPPVENPPSDSESSM